MIGDISADQMALMLYHSSQCEHEWLEVMKQSWHTATVAHVSTCCRCGLLRLSTTNSDYYFYPINSNTLKFAVTNGPVSEVSENNS